MPTGGRAVPLLRLMYEGIEERRGAVTALVARHRFEQRRHLLAVRVSFGPRSERNTAALVLAASLPSPRNKR